MMDQLYCHCTEIQSATNNDMSRKRATLSQLYRPPLELIFQGNFTEAKEAGSTLKKWLLVNVQDAREFSSHVLNRDVWHNSRVKSVVETSFLLWQVSCHIINVVLYIVLAF